MLNEMEKLFMWCLPLLIDEMHNRGYEIRGGDLFRDPRVHGEVGEKKSYSHSRSLHKSKCAIDLNLMKDGVYLTRTEDHQQFGDFWKSLDPLCEWGGDFGNKDGNLSQASLV